MNHVRPVRRHRGVALVLTLGFVALLSLLCLGLVEALKSRLVEQTAQRAQGELRMAAESALDLTLAKLGETLAADGAIFGPARGWPDPEIPAEVLGSGISATVRIEDESARFPLNGGDTAALSRLFMELGISEGRAALLADTLADWTDDDDLPRPAGAESVDYPEGAGPVNRPVESLEELAAIPAFRETFFDDNLRLNDLGRSLASVVTFYGDSHRVNINGASEAVLRLLADQVGANADAILRHRAGDAGRSGGVFRSGNDLARVGLPSALGARITYTPSLLRLVVTARRGDIAYEITALVIPGGHGGSGGIPFSFVRRLDQGLDGASSLVSEK